MRKKIALLLFTFSLVLSSAHSAFAGDETPDLIGKLSVQFSVLDGKYMRFTVNFENKILNMQEKSFQMQMLLDGKIVRDEMLPVSSASFAIDYPIQALDKNLRTHSLKVLLDPQNLIQELNECNEQILNFKLMDGKTYFVSWGGCPAQSRYQYQPPAYPKISNLGVLYAGFGWDVVFDLAENAKVTTDIYVNGNIVKTLIKQSAAKGKAMIPWDGKDNSGYKVKMPFVINVKTENAIGEKDSAWVSVGK